MESPTNSHKQDFSLPSPQDKARGVALMRYGLALLITGFIYREIVYMTATPYPGWLFIVLFISVILLLLPFERFWQHDHN